MTFFLSCEAQSSGAALLMRFHNQTESRLNTLADRSYGPELTNISIITIFLSEEMLSDGGFRERKRFMRASCTADLRLRLNHKAFLSATPEQRAVLYCDHIIASVETLRCKVSKSFRFDDLIQDVTALLSDPEYRSNLTAIRRFP